jgi:glycosyltransferase involved in cell wall biosynthesis
MIIGQIMAGAAQGGAELFFERMSIALARDNIVLPLIRAEPARLARLREAGLAPQTFRFGGRLDPFTRPRLRMALTHPKADVAIAWMSRAAQHLPRRVCPTIGRLGGYYDLKYFRNCQHLVGNTRGIVAYLTAHGIASDHAHYLPNFVTDFAGVEPADRAALGVPDHAPLILALGRLHRVKGFDTLIAAMAHLPDTYCLIAGEGPERAALTALIDRLDIGHRVKLIGWRQDTGPLLKSADLFVSASRHEPLGNMVLEAFSAQTPVLATDAEGPSEVIRDGIDGILVPRDNPQALAAAAARLLGDVTLRVRLALAARQRFADEFSEATVLAAWMELLHKVAG